MALGTLLNMQNKTKIGAIELECTISERHSIKNELSRYPIESGFSIADHIQLLPETVTLEFIFSSTPLRVWENFRGIENPMVFTKYSRRVKEQFLLLINYAGRGIQGGTGEFIIHTTDIEPITLVSGLAVYQDMYITSLDFDIDSPESKLPCRVELTRIPTVSSDNGTQLTFTKTAPPKPKTKQAEATKDLKNKGAIDTPPDKAAKGKTMVLRGITWLGLTK